MPVRTASSVVGALLVVGLRLTASSADHPRQPGLASSERPQGLDRSWRSQRIRGGSAARPTRRRQEPGTAEEEDEDGPTLREARRQALLDEMDQSSRPSWLPDNVPGFTFQFDPVYYLKLRKSFFPLRTKLTLGADFNTQSSVWQLRTMWEDRIIGGRLTIKGRELQLTKSWPVPIGERSDLAARLRFKLGIDLYSGRTYCRFGFRTEDTGPPASLTDGFELTPKFPLDANNHVNIEVKSRVAVPTPNLEFKSELGPGKKLDLSMGDVYVGVEELSLCLEY